LDKQNCFNNKKILITGSNGFVGRNLVEKLSEYDCDIYGLGV
jgi:nucleoside-diphosphate-sugar epimerase